MSRIKDETGKTYGDLYVICYAEMRKKAVYWWTFCVCGAEKVILGSNLRSGNSKSCGCKRHKKKEPRG